MKINLNLKGKGIIGWIEGGVFYSSRNTTDHYFRKFAGYGISKSVINALESHEIHSIVLIIDHSRNLITDLDTLVLKGEIWKDGEDTQVILPEKFWKSGIVVEKQSKLTP